MKNFAEMKVSDAWNIVFPTIKKIKKTYIIIFVIFITISYVVYAFISDYKEKKEIANEAQNIATEISNNQKEFFAENKKYDKEYFEHYGQDDDLGFDNMNYEKRHSISSRYQRGRLMDDGENNVNDASASQIGNFYVEIDANNACMVLKYKRNTAQKTIFYASFEDGKPLCTGKKCLHKNIESDTSICYRDSECFQPMLKEKTTKTCGNNHGTQTRECTPSCTGGNCGEWSECACQKGYGWNGTTCTQLQTERDCTPEQCFNGISCEDKEPLKKEIEKGKCTRTATCQSKGWKYTEWKCSCQDENFCALKEECIAKPEKQKSMKLTNEKDSCSDIYYICQQGLGWQAYAEKCSCNDIGTFWNKKVGKANCSSCTKKPNNAYFISAGTDEDNCKWECNKDFENRNGNCVKPNGQFVCARMNPQICTDDFSKDRKLKKDTDTNEGQPCFSEDNENILFYTAKTQVCILCQCFDFNQVKN